MTTVTLCVLAACRASRTDDRPALVLISIDGFRSEYLDRYDAPHLRELARRGVRARWMQPSFPVLTFPNHYTLVTGLLPEHHGIVANEMRDPSGARFSYKDSGSVRDSAWWGGEPLWVTAERQGVRAASFFWPGSEAPIHGVRPTFYKHYREDVSLADRVDTVLAWLTRPDSLRPRAITVYFSTVDHAGHDHGPNSPEVRAAVLAVDSAVGRLVGGLEAARLADRVNVVVVSDHGMAETSPDRVVWRDSYVPTQNVEALSTYGAIAFINPVSGDTNSMLRSLRRAPHMHFYRGDSVPAEWRYAGTPRIAAIVGVPEEGWLFMARPTRPTAPHVGGSHGYLATDTSMHALFIAAGPAFRSGVTAEPFGNIHVYDLLCAALGLTPAPNDGSPDSTKGFLKQP